MIKGMVFDLDDTVYDYQSCNQYAVSRLGQYCMDKFCIPKKEFDTIYERSKNIVKERLQDTAASHNRMLYMQTFLEQILQRPAVCALELYHIYWDTMLKTMELYDYVLPLFRELASQGIQIAVLTDLTAQIQHRKMIRLGIAEYVDVLVTSEEAGKEKPDPAMFELVIQKLQLHPEQLVMVGDSFEKDIEGAKLAGMHGILYSREKEDTIIRECMELIGNEAQREQGKKG
ncbi:MAG: HAD family hydrolase [Eubacterium sp.]|nr:HAD family hydrolase [Eubacterium sp.]